MRKKLYFMMTVATVGIALVACGKKNETEDNQVTEQGMEEDRIEENDMNNRDTMEEMVEDGSTNTDAESDSIDDVTADNEVIDTPVTDVTGTVAILDDVWKNYGDEEKFFSIGGDMANPVDNAPGAFDMDDTESLSSMLYIPADSISLVDEAASLIHAMNANTFTGAAFHLVDSANAETLATSIKDNIYNTQWMCGFPEKLMIFNVNEEYIISAFGNGEIMETFKQKVTDVYGEHAVVLVEEMIE